jgi:hypothetical protein
LTAQEIKTIIQSKGYVWFDGGDYDVNIISFRNPKTGRKVTNQFDDLLTLTYKENGNWIVTEYPVTVDPGTKPMQNPSNKKGCAILVPGQYRSTYTVRLHANKYEALCQKLDKPVKVYRDNTKDTVYNLDPTTIEAGVFGINIHRSSLTGESNTVDDWSEGCTVFKRLRDFNEFMSIINKSKNLYGNSFTYTLI